MRAMLAAAVSASMLGAFAGVSVAASASDLVASVACRDGAPNGAYELRMPDGRLRILGAFAKGRRTGTFLFWASSGARIAVVPYDDDAKVGTVAVWYSPSAPQAEPRRKLEAAFAAGVRHGITRSWHADGRRRTEYLYERGNLVAANAWSASGASLAESEARRTAEQDAVADADFLSGLERTIAENGPRCD
jgi:antitoxin component YwqK of YwqJK toxin-antitoxin module